ncbi:MAG: alpha/beta hydrolase, partial [Acidobacteria bacterium]|nr:alpha/beta hydrolase [Acidobacteriota bacterium]
LASRKPCAGLVLEAPFSSARAVAARVLPLIGPLLVWSYDSKSKIQRVACPVLVIHGDRDEVIDYSLGRELFAAAHEPKRFWTVEHAGHNDLLEVARPHYGRRLADFYASL